MVKLRSWNTGDPERINNTSHAEAQVAAWIGEDSGRNAKVVSLDLVVQKKSPCRMCVNTLRVLARSLKSREGGSAVTLTLSWSGSLHRDWKDNEGSLNAALSAAGWHPSGAKDAGAHFRVTSAK